MFTIYLFADSFDAAIEKLQDAPSFFQDALQWGIDASYVYMGWISLLALLVYFFKK
jgi:hypothetical protein